MKNICDWNNCSEEGLFKAPKERDNSKDYRLLCLNHVKEFNKSWNYFTGMSDQQIVDFLRSDMTWHKPTQSFSSSDNFFKVLWSNALKDEMDKFKFNIKKKIIYALSIFGFVIILGLLLFFISQSKKNESNLTNKLILLEKRF